MKKFKENKSKLQKLNDWLNAYEIEGDRGPVIALVRHFLLFLVFGVGMLIIALFILKSSGV
jgi:hypothetical protein